MKKIGLAILCLTAISTQILAQGYRVNRTQEKKASIRNIDLGHNIISFAPIQMILSDVNQDSPDLAVGFSYERITDNGMIGIKLPFSFSLMDKGYYYFMPTIKLYPFKQGNVRFSIGPQFLIGYGQVTYDKWVNDPLTSSFSIVKTTDYRTQFGFLINNAVNFTFSKNLYVGVDGALGLKYFDNLTEAQQNNYYNNLYSNKGQVSPSFQLNFNMGIRF